MIALLCSPPAKGLFRAAILQSDPMVSHHRHPYRRTDRVYFQAFGLASRAITSQLQSYFYSSSPMSSCKTLACLQGLPISEIIAAQDQLIDNAPYDITGIPLAEGESLISADKLY
jgi:carboxylesterase type B